MFVVSFNLVWRYLFIFGQVFRGGERHRVSPVEGNHLFVYVCEIKQAERNDMINMPYRTTVFHGIARIVIYEPLDIFSCSRSEVFYSVLGFFNTLVVKSTMNTTSHITLEFFQWLITLTSTTLAAIITKPICRFDLKTISTLFVTDTDLFLLDSTSFNRLVMFKCRCSYNKFQTMFVVIIVSLSTLCIVAIITGFAGFKKAGEWLGIITNVAFLGSINWCIQYLFLFRQVLLVRTFIPTYLAYVTVLDKFVRFATFATP